jgi:hypothetical protein
MPAGCYHLKGLSDMASGLYNKHIQKKADQEPDSQARLPLIRHLIRHRLARPLIDD